MIAQPEFIKAVTLKQLKMDLTDLRGQVLEERVLQQIDSELRDVLSRGLVFELSVPREAIIAICKNISASEQQIDRAIGLGLLEVTPEQTLRVPRILPLTLPKNVEILCKQAARAIYTLWLEQNKTVTPFHLQEARQLALKGKDELLANEVWEAWIGYYKTLPSYGRLDFSNPLNSMYLDQ